MIRAVVKSLSMALFFLLATSNAAGDDSQIATSPISRPLGDADLVCSATILGTWRTSDSLDARLGERDYFAQSLPTIAAAMRAHGCTNLKTEVIRDSTHYVAQEQPAALAALIERHAVE